ncbi:MAG: DMT family transporter [Lachnospiraceae bacterium]|nr:DMT family transporter [Lachnospiraceae bacterium]
MSGEKKGRPWLLLLTAVIWGTGFIAQRAGSVIPSFTFTALRSLIGALFLVPVIKIMDRHRDRKPETGGRKTLLAGGMACGFFLFAASNLQQYGIELGSTAGNAGFITSCYILIVPILGIFLKRKCSWNVWVSVAAALAGLYLLCIDGPFVLRKEDLFLFACAFVFALHILCIDHFTVRTDGVKMAALQFLFCGILSLAATAFIDYRMDFNRFAALMHSIVSTDAWISILYAGAVSSGIGYTLQIVGQKNVNPTVASLLMSLESVFSVLFGWLLLSEKMTNREILGCGILFAAVVFAQLKITNKSNTC